MASPRRSAATWPPWARAEGRAFVGSHGRKNRRTGCMLCWPSVGVRRRRRSGNSCGSKGTSWSSSRPPAASRPARASRSPARSAARRCAARAEFYVPDVDREPRYRRYLGEEMKSELAVPLISRRAGEQAHRRAERRKPGAGLLHRGARPHLAGAGRPGRGRHRAGAAHRGRAAGGHRRAGRRHHPSPEQSHRRVERLAGHVAAQAVLRAN